MMCCSHAEEDLLEYGVRSMNWVSWQGPVRMGQNMIYQGPMSGTYL